MKKKENQKKTARKSFYSLADEVLEYGTFSRTLTADDGDLRQIELHSHTELRECILEFVNNRYQLFHSRVSSHVFASQPRPRSPTRRQTRTRAPENPSNPSTIPFSPRPSRLSIFFFSNLSPPSFTQDGLFSRECLRCVPWAPPNCHHLLSKR